MKEQNETALEGFIEKVETLVQTINTEVKRNVITTAGGKLGHELLEGINIASNMVEEALQDHNLINEVASVKLLVEGVHVSAGSSNPDERLKEVIQSIIEHTRELEQLDKTPEMDNYRASMNA